MFRRPYVLLTEGHLICVGMVVKKLSRVLWVWTLMGPSAENMIVLRFPPEGCLISAYGHSAWAEK